MTVFYGKVAFAAIDKLIGEHIRVQMDGGYTDTTGVLSGISCNDTWIGSKVINLDGGRKLSFSADRLDRLKITHLTTAEVVTMKLTGKLVEV